MTDIREGPDGDRRRMASGVRNRPRASPANILILGIAAVLAASAVAAAMLGNGVEETTPHGQILSSLQLVADAQEAHHRETGSFAGWLHTLGLEPVGEVQVTVIRGTETDWEVMASHAVGLSCVQAGRVEAGRALRDAPVCYTSGD
jgi:hypothetical protein